MSARLTPTQARRVARAQAIAAGCTCHPVIAYRPTGLVDVQHDPWCALAHAGRTAVAVLVGDSVVPVAVDLTSAIDLAERTGAMVLDAGAASIVVPPGVNPPGLLGEWCDVARIDRPGGVVRVYMFDDDAVAAWTEGER